MSKGGAAIVTGGGQGIGRAICEALLSKGFKVCIADIDESVGRATKDELSKKYGSSNVIFVTCDVSEESHFTRVFEEVLGTFGSIDVLVNNAGIGDESNIERMIKVNLFGPIYGCRTAIKFMGKDNGGKGGSVVNTASLAGLTPFALCPIYAATKHGVVGLTRSFGTPQHYDKHGITFSALCPGFVKTPLSEKMEGTAKEEVARVCRSTGKIEPEFAAKGVIKLLDEQRNGATLLVTERQGLKYIELGEELQNVKLS